jgi:MerR family transcriptional regulator, light-induced transcriptional regulator
MASVFGISGLRSRLDSWWGTRKNGSNVAFEEPVASVPKLHLVTSREDNTSLSLILENVVIPKLMAGETGRAASTPAMLTGDMRRDAISTDDVTYFARLSVTGDSRAMLDFVDQRLANGSSVEAIFVELLAPAARKLGQNWEDDSGDFVDVTMGLWRIQEILRELTLRDPPSPKNGYGQRSALFSTMPGEQHSFGTLMVAECFERAGWDTDILIEPSQSELCSKAAKQHFDLIGLTVSNDCPTAALGSLVRSIKAVSCNAQVRILLGGRAINEQPELVQICGADATAIDAPTAVALADRLIPAKADVFAQLI